MWSRWLLREHSVGMCKTDEKVEKIVGMISSAVKSKKRY